MASNTQGRDIALIILIILVVLILLGGGGMMGLGMMGGWYGMMGGYFNPLWGIAMMVFWVLVIGGIALLVVWLLRSYRTTPLVGPTERVEEAPIEILKKRYAKGEITKEQFEQMRKDLE